MVLKAQTKASRAEIGSFSFDNQGLCGMTCMSAMYKKSKDDNEPATFELRSLSREYPAASTGPADSNLTTRTKNPAIYCRPLRQSETGTLARMSVPAQASAVQVAFLPPMSGLAATETRLVPGAVNVLVGEGRTAEVLCNLCFRVHEEQPDAGQKIVTQIQNLFGADLQPPLYIYIAERGEIAMTYRERETMLELASAGRGLQQTLLLLAYMYANPGAVMLLDEPDAHLEILRQRQIYRLLSDGARQSGSQLIAASHSEVLLNEAAGRDLVFAFGAVGPPHRIDGSHSQVLKGLASIGFEQYCQAEQVGWVLDPRIWLYCRPVGQEIGTCAGCRRSRSPVCALCAQPDHRR